MTTTFSPFAQWALAIPVPALGLPALANPTHDDLVRRSFEISFDLCDSQSDDELAQTLVQLGALDYLPESCYGKR
jgi:hypothetical protein